jgi:arsenite-transporting ATPase
MTLDNLLDKKDLHFLLFGGKGGVGKTSCSAATALYIAETKKRKVLIISTDPAHSLGDSLGQTLQPGEITKIEGVNTLWGLEINPKYEQSQVSDALSMISDEDSPLGSEFKDLSGLNPPGIDEAMAFGKVLQYLDKADYDLIIFDTAPTGHTLRLLSIPDVLSGWMGKIITLRFKFGKLFGAFKTMFSKKKKLGDIDDQDPIEMLQALKDSIEHAKETLNNPDKTSFVICTIAEVMSIYETERLLSSLMEFEIPATNIVINQLYPENQDCKFCMRRREMQQRHLEELRDLYSDDFELTEVPLFDNEIRKLDGLRMFAKSLFG